MDAPHVSELDLRVGEEAVITLMQVLSVIGGATVQHMAVVVVVREESLAKLFEAQAVVSVHIVSRKEQCNLVSSWEYANRS